MTTDNRPALPEVLEDAGQVESFRVREPVEIRHLLKSVMDRNVPVTLNGSDGTVHASSLWAVDSAQGRISFPADLMSPAVHRLVEAEEATAVCYLDQIKLQFDLRQRMLVHGHQTCVLQAAMPRELFRFQRRHAYRVRTLERSAPMAILRHPAVPDMLLELRVLDLSAGGCALFMPNDMPALEPGGRINGVRIELDPDIDFHASLMVHHVTSIQPQARGVRLGCEFVNISPDAQRMLQRYIDHTQKRRRMLSLD